MEALFYHREGEYCVCGICPRYCRLKEGQTGFCGVRRNDSGKIVSLVYGKVAAYHIDPIEKKPLFHFFPGGKVMSFGTVGCNLSCKHCQNWQISQNKELFGEDITPLEIVEDAIANGCKMIAATYNEPTVFFEFMIDTFKIAKEKGLYTVVVSNGFISPEPLKELINHSDAFNIDLKSIEEGFYRKVTSSWISPILESIKMINSSGKHLEITNLVIPGKNSSEQNLKELSRFVATVDKKIPLHFSAFFPMHKMLDISPTEKNILDKAYKIAKEEGLLFVYQGNLRGQENTYCPSCGVLVIERFGYKILKNKTKKGFCPCGEKILYQPKDH